MFVRKVFVRGPEKEVREGGRERKREFKSPPHGERKATNQTKVMCVPPSAVPSFHDTADVKC